MPPLNNPLLLTPPWPPPFYFRCMILTSLVPHVSRYLIQYIYFILHCWGQTQGLQHARQAVFHWATLPALFFCDWLILVSRSVLRSIHAAERSKCPTFLKAGFYSTVWIWHISLIHLSIGGHSGCVPILALVTDAAVNISPQSLACDSFGYVPRSLQDWMVILFIIS
jgi:hypothetical protein